MILALLLAVCGQPAPAPTDSVILVDSLAAPMAVGLDSSVSPRVDPLVVSDSTHPAAQAAHPPIATDSVRMLGLDEAVERMIENNADLRAAVYNWIGQNTLKMAAWGAFEPRFTASASEKSQGRKGQDRPERHENLRTALKGTLPTGTGWELAYEHNAVENATPKALSLMQTSATLRQPLLRGLLYGGSWNSIVSAKAAERRAFHDLRNTLMSLFSDLLEAYWDTYASQHQCEVDSQSVAVARDLLADGSRRAARGLLSPLELERITAELALRMARLLDAGRQLGEARTRLSLILGDSTMATRWIPTPLLALDDDSLEVSASRLDSLLDQHPELGSARSEVVRLQADRDAHRSKSLPLIDLTGSVGRSATAYGDQVLRRKYDDPERIENFMSVGIEIEIPIFADLQERGAAIAGDMALRVAQLKKTHVASRLRQNALDLARRATSFRETSRQQTVVVQYHTLALGSELRRLRAGLSSYQIVYEVEEKLREAQRARLEALKSYRITRAQLERTTGTLLVDLGLETRHAAKIHLRADLTRNP